MSARDQREFFTVKTLSEAPPGFRPERRTPVESVSLDDALGRVSAEPVAAPHALPGFARATVDGFAVRAADTYGASERGRRRASPRKDLLLVPPTWRTQAIQAPAPLPWTDVERRLPLPRSEGCGGWRVNGGAARAEGVTSRNTSLDR